MPVPKPKPKESQSEFMGRCMHEVGGKHPQDQAVAICMSQWRESHSGKPPKKGKKNGVKRNTKNSK